MVDTISKQISSINDSLKWIKRHRPEDYQSRFMQLADERRKLRKLRKAEECNPAVAAYGVSQVGKSYLMNCMLQKDGQPFQLETQERKYNFIEEMNPKTDNTEATGVVTRFTSYSRNPQDYDIRYPIAMRCLSVADLVLILADSYFNDIANFTTDSEADLTALAESMAEKYSAMHPNPDSPLQADDILDMKEYFKKNLRGSQAFLNASFFDKLALVADRIPPRDWVDVFSVLWKGDKNYTKLLARMLQTLERLSYSPYIYLKADAMLHNGINENTIVSVECLNQLFLENPVYFTDAYIRSGDNYIKVEHLTKSEVCAVCAEIVVKIGDDYLDNTSGYCFEGISDSAVAAKLSKEPVKMDLLRTTDMLDFPGARSRKKELLNTLDEDKILINVLLRGKVAYLFNLYNEARLINILLYCHHGAQHDVNDIPMLLQRWITTYVGETMDERRRTLQITDGVSPLFYIATKFNIDMSEKVEEISNSENAINGRWQQRFDKVLWASCFNGDGAADSEGRHIFTNWTAPGEHFSNSYLLRDFKYSGPQASHIYENERTPQHRMLMGKEYYERLRSTFVSHEAVKRLFAHPELAWDAAASIDNDGALFIIEHLSKVGRKIGEARSELSRSAMMKSIDKVAKVMAGYYVSTDADELLKANLKKARTVMRELDFTCNTDNYYFGHLLQALQMSETEVFCLIHEILMNPEVNEDLNTYQYELINSRCAKSGYDINAAAGDSAKWECLMKTYDFDSEEEAQEFLTRRGVDKAKLFAGTYMRKKNSYIVADAVFDRWVKRLKGVEFAGEFGGDRKMDTIVLSNLIDCIVDSANRIGLRDSMAHSVSQYLDVVSAHSANESLVADVLADKINNFVLDLGYSTLSADDRTKARDLCRRHNIPVGESATADAKDAGIEEMTDLFNSMSSDPRALLPSFEEHYTQWMEYMYLAFIASLEVPMDFDLEANTELGKILAAIRQ